MADLLPTSIGTNTSMCVQPFFDERTATITYVVHNTETLDAIVIDPVLDYDPLASLIWSESTDIVVNFIKTRNLILHAILETHAHADHLSGARRIQESFPNAKIAIGEHITDVQSMFRSTFALPKSFPTDGSQFDFLLEDNATYQAGALSYTVLPTPGHTPACVSILMDNAVFAGDSLLMPDIGTGRCDFPGGSAHAMYQSVTENLFTLPDETRIFIGHDYPPATRSVEYASTIAEQKANNRAITPQSTIAQFTHWRNERDDTLSPPRLLFQSIQVNIVAGQLPEPNAEGQRTLQIPLNIFRPEPKATPDNLTLA